MLDFYPTTPPLQVQTEKIVIRPLHTTDVELDYEAVMSSKEMLRMWSMSSWPRDDFPIEENFADLDRHETEHIKGIAFTYTVMNPTQTKCLGCLYINPLHRLGEIATLAQTDNTPCTSFWVIEEQIANDLDLHLLQTLQDWFAQEWAFGKMWFWTSERNGRQHHLLKQVGLTHKHSAPVTHRHGTGWFYQ